MDKLLLIQKYRGFIATARKRMTDKVDKLEGLLDEEWDDFEGARQTLNELTEGIGRMSRLISKLEDILCEESNQIA